MADKNKKAKFQEGDYSDIDIKGIIDTIKVEIKPAEMPKFKKKKTITVPRDSKNIKKFKGGGIAARGLGRAFMKGGKV